MSPLRPRRSHAEGTEPGALKRGRGGPDVNHNGNPSGFVVGPRTHRSQARRRQPLRRRDRRRDRGVHGRFGDRLPDERACHGDLLRRDELRPFLHHTIGSIDLPVEIRKWRTGDFSNRFIFPEPTTCPRVTVYLATPETTERVEQENDGIPTRQALEDWTMTLKE